MKQTTPRALIALLVALTATTGCGEEEDPQPMGQLSVAWQLPSTCTKLRLTTVEVRLYSHLGLNGGPSYSDASACAGGPLVIDEILEGTYTVVVEAFSGDDKALYWAVLDSVVVGENAELDLSNVEEGTTPMDQPIVQLEPKPGALDVSWSFDNGQLCSQNGVEDIQITLIDEDGNFVTEDVLYFPCDPFSTPEAERIVGVSPDPLHTLEGILVGSLMQGDHIIDMYGLDSDAKRVYNASEAIYVERGAIGTLSLKLFKCANLHCE